MQASNYKAVGSSKAGKAVALPVFTDYLLKVVIKYQGNSKIVDATLVTKRMKNDK